MSNREPEQRFNNLQDMGRALGGQPQPQPPANRGGPSSNRGPGGQDTGGFSSYLRDGYFETGETGGSYLRVTLLTDTAQRIAQMLSGPRMKPHQIRRFFSHVRALESSLRNGAEFAAIVPGIAKLEPAATNAVTRGLAPVEFQQFIEQNAREARKSERHFRDGFVAHFEAVVAYLPKEGR